MQLGKACQGVRSKVAQFQLQYWSLQLSFQQEIIGGKASVMWLMHTQKSIEAASHNFVCKCAKIVRDLCATRVRDLCAIIVRNLVSIAGSQLQQRYDGSLCICHTLSIRVVVHVPYGD